jgi:uncharacterized membrane protein
LISALWHMATNTVCLQMTFNSTHSLITAVSYACAQVLPGVGVKTPCPALNVTSSTDESDVGLRN